MDCGENSNGLGPVGADLIERQEVPDGDSEMNPELDDNDDVIVDLKHRIQTLCEQKLPNGQFLPSCQTVTVWKTVFSIAYDYPSILNHPDLSAIRQLFLFLGVRLHGNDSNFSIPIDDQPKHGTKQELEETLEKETTPPSEAVGKELALFQTNHVRNNENGSQSPNTEIGVHPVQLMIGHIEDLEYDLESRMVTIRKYSMMPGIKQHVNQILVFLLTQPNELHGPSCGFITKFLTHFGVKDTDVTRFVGLVSSLNGKKENYSRTHYAVKSWLRSKSLTAHGMLEKEVMPEPKYDENGEGRDYWLEWLHKTCVRRLENLNDARMNGARAHSKSQHVKSSSHNSKLKSESRCSSDITEYSTSSDEDGFNGKGRHKKRKHWKQKRARPLHHLTSVVPLSLHPRSKFRACRIDDSGGSSSDLRRYSNDFNMNHSRLRMNTDRPRLYNSADFNQRKMDNDKKPYGCPSRTGCTVRFLYKSTMLKHFSLKHPNEIMPPDSGNKEIIPEMKNAPANGIRTQTPPSPQKRGRYSVENDKKPYGCPSATGCPVRFLYENTMMKHFRDKHSKEALLASGIPSTISAAIIPVNKEDPSRSIKIKTANRPSLKLKVRQENEKDALPKKKESELATNSSGLKTQTIENVQQQFNRVVCPSTTGCTVTFEKRKYMLKHFRRRHPDEPLPYLTTPSRTGRSLLPPQANTKPKQIEQKPKPVGAVLAGRFRRGNAEKPYGCPSKTGCPVRFLYEVTMQRHFIAQHPDEAKHQA